MRFTALGIVNVDSLGLSPAERAAFGTILNMVEDAGGNDHNAMVLLAAGLARATRHGMEYYAVSLDAPSIVENAANWCGIGEDTQ